MAIAAMFVSGKVLAQAVERPDLSIELIDPKVLRVCADPNNMPFSTDGFENKLAELLAEKLGKGLSYSWYPQATGFVRNTLAAHNRHFADEIYRLAALFENACIPFELVNSSLVGIRSILKLMKLKDRGADLGRKSFCLRKYRHFAAFMIECLEQSSSFAFFCRSDSVLMMTSEIAFSACSSGVRRAASRATKSFIPASSSQAFPTSSMAGPAHTAATEISGTLT
jgi:hypothetical protein